MCKKSFIDKSYLLNSKIKLLQGHVFYLYTRNNAEKY